MAFDSQITTRKAATQGQNVAVITRLCHHTTDEDGTLTATGGTSPLPVVIAGASSGSSVVVGAAAHDAAISGAPVRTGARAVTANVAAVATGDAVDNIATTVGAQIIKPFSIPEADWQYAAAGAIADTNAVSMKAAVADLRNYVTAIQLSNTDASVATIVQILSAATVLWQGLVVAQTAAVTGVPVVNIVFPTPLRGAVNEAINVKCVTNSAEVYANAQGYTAP